MISLPPPPKLDTVCPLHRDHRLIYAEIFDGRAIYECPVPRCSVCLEIKIEPTVKETAPGEEA